MGQQKKETVFATRRTLLGIYDRASKGPFYKDPETGDMLLHEAAILTDSTLLDACLSFYKKSCKTPDEHKEIIDAVSIVNDTPIANACKHGRNENALKLIKAGSCARNKGRTNFFPLLVLDNALKYCEPKVIDAVIETGEYTTDELHESFTKNSPSIPKATLEYLIDKKNVDLSSAIQTSHSGTHKVTALQNFVREGGVSIDHYMFLAQRDRQYATNPVYRKNLIALLCHKHEPREDFIAFRSAIIDDHFKKWGDRFSVEDATSMIITLIHDQNDPDGIELAMKIFDRIDQTEIEKDDDLLMWSIRNDWLGNVSKLGASGYFDIREKSRRGQTYLEFADEIGAKKRIRQELKELEKTGSSVSHIQENIVSTIRSWQPS